jgi:sugar lactone lactonase YvrE
MSASALPSSLSDQPASAPAGAAAGPTTPSPAASNANPIGWARPEQSGELGSSQSFDRPPRLPRPASGKTTGFATVGPPAIPDGIAIGPDLDVFVAVDDANGTPSRIEHLGADGRHASSIAIVGQPRSHTVGVTGLAWDRRDGIIALDASTGRVLDVNLATSEQFTLAQIPDVPACGAASISPAGCEPGVMDHPTLPRYVAVDDAGAAYVSDPSQGIIWRIRSGAHQAEQWLTSPTFSGGNGLAGIAVDDDGSVVVASPQPLDVSALPGAGIYRIAIDATGHPGTPQLIHHFDRAEQPAGLTTFDDGAVVVALAGANAVALLDHGGSEVRRVRGGDGGPALNRPSQLASDGGAVLATDPGATGTPGAIVAIGLS